MSVTLSPNAEVLIAQLREANAYLLESRSKANFHEASLNSARGDVQATEHRIKRIEEQLLSAIKSPGAPAPGSRKINNNTTSTKAGV